MPSNSSGFSEYGIVQKNVFVFNANADISGIDNAVIEGDVVVQGYSVAVGIDEILDRPPADQNVMPL